MKIRIINNMDWEKSYDFDKSIIRVGSQIGSDVHIRDTEVAPLLIQIVRSGSVDVRNTMRFFAPDVILTRGDQSFPAEMNVPYEVLDGDKISFNTYRMIMTLENDRSRIRQTEHMRAEMFLSKRDLSPENPISGGLLLKNLGTQRPCQFRMNITGIPEECLTSAPLPYLHPDASSSVGFVISHLKTQPAPGFHTVSIILTAPEEYFGEKLEFNQDIYVQPVFENEMILEDDSGKLVGLNQKEKKRLEKDAEKKPEVPALSTIIHDTGMMNMDESVFASNPAPDDSVVLVKKEGDFEDDEDDEDDIPEGYRKKREKVVVIRSDEDQLFEGESDTAGNTEDAPAAEPQQHPVKRNRSTKRMKKSDARQQINEIRAQTVAEQQSKPEPEHKPIDPNVVVIRKKADDFWDEEPETPAVPDAANETESGSSAVSSDELSSQTEPKQETDLTGQADSDARTVTEDEAQPERDENVSDQDDKVLLELVTSNSEIGDDSQIPEAASWQNAAEAEPAQNDADEEKEAAAEPVEPQPSKRKRSSKRNKKSEPQEQSEEPKDLPAAEEEPKPDLRTQAGDPNVLVIHGGSDDFGDEEPETPAVSDAANEAEAVKSDAASDELSSQEGNGPETDRTGQEDSDGRAAAENEEPTGHDEALPVNEENEPEQKNDNEEKDTAAEPEELIEEPVTESEAEPSAEPQIPVSEPEELIEEPVTESEAEASAEPQVPVTEPEKEALPEPAGEEKTPEQDTENDETLAEPVPEAAGIAVISPYNALLSDDIPETDAEESSANEEKTSFGYRFSEQKTDGSETPIPIFHNASDFEDFGFDDEAEPVKTDNEKPEVRVLKGGDFD